MFQTSQQCSAAISTSSVSLHLPAVSPKPSVLGAPFGASPEGQFMSGWNPLSLQVPNGEYYFMGYVYVYIYI